MGCPASGSQRQMPSGALHAVVFARAPRRPDGSAGPFGRTAGPPLERHWGVARAPFEVSGAAPAPCVSLCTHRLTHTHTHWAEWRASGLVCTECSGVFRSVEHTDTSR